jgi:O-antigen ligase
MPNAPMKTLDSLLLAAVRYGLLAVFALPFVVVLKHLYPWVSGKIWGFQLIIEILFPLYVLLAFRRKEYRPSKDPFLYSLLAYFAVATLAMLLGENPHRSFWDKPDRLTGMFFQYHLLAFFLMAGAVWRRAMTLPIVASIVSAAILSLHAIAQVANPAPGSDGRGSATLGNPSYLGQYLVPHFFLCGWLVYRHWKTGLHWLWLSSAALLLIGVFMTKSKGALIGVFVGGAIAALIAAVRGAGAAKKWGRIGLALLGLAIAGFLVGHKIRPIHVWLYENRLSLQYIEETSDSRKLLLENAVKGVKQRPLLGWGPENFEDGFYFNYDPVTLRYSEYETRQDRPHNLVLEMLHNFGAIGFLAYLAVFGFAVRLALRKGRSDPAAGAVLLIAAFSQIATNLFIFETPMSYLALFFMLALVAADDGGREEAREEGSDESSAAAVPLFLLAAFVSVWCMRYAIVGTMRAAKLTSEMIIALSQNVDAETWKGMLAELRAQRTPYYERDIRALTSHLSRQRGEYLEGPFKEILIDLTEDEYRRLKDNRTDYVHALVTASGYLSFMPRTPEQQAALEDAAAIMAARSPNRHEVLAMLAQVAWEKGDLDAAEAHLLRMRELDPENPYGDGWWARWQIEFRDPAAGVKHVAEHPAVIKDPEAWRMVEYATLFAMNRKRWDALDAIQKASAEHGIRNVQWDLTGAIAAWAKGDKARSDALVQEALALYPDRAELIRQIAATRDQIVANGG